MDISRFKGGNKEKVWADWLGDEPVQPDVAPARPPAPVGHRPPGATYQSRTTAAPKTPIQPQTTAVAAAAQAVAIPAAPKIVQIDVKLPKLSKPRLKTLMALRPPQNLPYARIGAGVAVLAVLIVVGGVGRGLLKPDGSGAAAVSKSHASTGPTLSAPSFAPVVPKDKPQLGQLGSDNSTAFDGKRDSYSFSDTFLGTSLTVSEQPIPATFSSPDTAVSKTAGQIGAKQAIGTGKSVAYMKTDDKSNSQIIVFSRNNLLIFIQSPFKHDPVNWQDYLDNLQ